MMMSRPLLRLLYLLAFGLPALLPIHAWATTYTVTDSADNSGDTGSIRYAVAHAVTGDTINITTTGSQVVVLGSTLAISQGVTINGPTSGMFTLSGNLNGYGVMEVGGTAAVTINNLTLEDALNNGNGGGALVDSGATVNFTNCSFSGNGAPSGGGLYNSGTATLTNCTVGGNSASGGNGGAIANVGTITLTNCNLDTNSAGNSGTGSGGGLYNTGTATMTGCTISGDTAPGSGGGVENTGNVTLTNCILTADSSTSTASATGGGGLYNHGATANVTNCSFDGNTATTDGKDVFSDAGTVNLTNDILFTTDSIIAGSSTVSVSYCDLGNPGGIGYTDNGHNISADPHFARAPHTTGNGVTDYGDLHLGYASPCLGAGTSAGAPALDFDGFTRPAPPSMGAFDAPQSSLTVNNTGDTGTATGSLGVNLTGATTLRAAVGYANDYTGVAIGFDPTVFASARTISEVSAGLTLSAPMTITGPSAGVNVSGSNVFTVFTVSSTTGTVTLSGLTIEGANSTTNFLGFTVGGSGVVVSTGASAVLTGCTLTGNSAGGSGFGGGVSNAGALTLTGCTLTGNSAGSGGSGGGLYNSGTAAIILCAFNNNTGNSGAGMANTGTATLASCTFTGNNGSGVGGALDNSGGVGTTAIDCTFSGNSAAGGGGGVYNLSALTLTNCVFASNTAPGSGGTAAPGGGVYNDSNTSPSATADIVNCTFTANVATNSGGAVASYGGVTLLNDILYGDSAPISSSSEISNFATGDTSAAYSDIGEALSADGTTDNGHNVNANPQFVGPPANLRLQAGSPAIGAGTAANAPTTDITGAARPNPPSLGAYDVNAGSGGAGGGTTPVSTTTAVTSSLNPSTVGQSVTFTATVAPSSGTGMPTGTVTFTVDGTAGSPVTLTNGGATLTTSALTQGSHTVTAAYSGDANFAASTSGTLNQTVSTASTTTPALLTTFQPGLQMVCLNETYTDFAQALTPSGTLPAPPAYDTYDGNAYMLADSTTEAAPSPGTGFWIAPSSVVNIYDTGAPPTGPVTLSLHRGWNLVGSPQGLYPLTNITVTGNGSTATGMANANAAGLLYGTLYTLGTGNTTSYTVLDGTSSGAELGAYTGYWLYAFQSGETLTFPAVQGAAR